MESVHRAWFLQRFSGGLPGGLLMGFMLLLMWQALAMAAPAPAGSVIENQAKAFFTDENGQEITLYSNIVTAEVQAVEGLSLLENPIFLAAPDDVDSCVPQRLVNTGNVAIPLVNLTLTAAPVGSPTTDASTTTGYEIDAPELILDINGDGRSNGEPVITSVTDLEPGQAVNLLLCGDIPGGLNDDDLGRFDLRADSETIDPNVQTAAPAIEDDYIRVRAKGAISVFKSVSNSNPVRGATVIFTLAAKNTGLNDVDLIDVVVDNNAEQLIIVRDELPDDLTFAGFPDSPAAGDGRVLYHLSGTTHNYTEFAPADLSQVNAIAVGYDEFDAGQQHSYRFNALVNDTASGLVENTAVASFNNGAEDIDQPSNTVTLQVPDLIGQRIEGIVFGMTPRVNNAAIDNGPISDVRVRLLDVDGTSAEGSGRTDCGQFPGDIACVFNDDMTNGAATVLTPFNGFFEFPRVQPGTYKAIVLPAISGRAQENDCIEVGDCAVGFPSEIDPALQPTQRRVNPGASYGFNFDLNSGGVFIFDIPLTGRRSNGNNLILMDKVASQSAVDLGDIVRYTVKVENTANVTADDVLVEDTLPIGFVYIDGSAKLNGNTLPASQVILSGRNLAMQIGDLAPDDTVVGSGADYAEVTYRLRVAPGALQGNGLNIASSRSDNGLQGGPVSALVRFEPDLFSDRGFIVGKVYSECSFDEYQHHEEVGIPGVRLYLQDGSFAITDSEGKYSFAGLRPQTYVIKVDPITLPVGFEMRALSNRHAGDAQSRFIDLKSGLLHKADFADTNCSDATKEQIQQRREMGGIYRAEVETVLDRDLQLDRRPVTRELQTLAASGVNKGQEQISYAGISRGNPIVRDPGVTSPTDLKEGARSDQVAVAAAGLVDLEELLPSLNNEFGFVNLSDGDVLPGTTANIRVKGIQGSEFQLFVNDELVPNSRVGQRSQLTATQTQAWEYVSVKMQSGNNVLEAVLVDQFGNERDKQTITVLAPDAAAYIRLTVPKQPVADGVTPAVIGVDLIDERGVPVTARTPISLEASHGQWQIDDLDPEEPGVQTFLERGRADFLLLSPQDPGDVKIRAATGSIVSEAEIDFVPELRPMIAVGLIEGKIALRNKVEPALDDDPFERELESFALEEEDGKLRAGARSAFFLKGRILGKYLLTASYDNEKPEDERLFRDIQPDRFYPIYGDASVKGFEAQSTSDLYVRVDAQRSFLQYGDYTTPNAGSVLGLSRFSRSLTGGLAHLEGDLGEVNAFASYDSERRIVITIDPRGISGPYSIPAFDPNAFRENSEKVEIIVFNGNTPGVVKEIQLQRRFTDYQFDRAGGRITFRRPVFEFQADDGVNHPQQIRVSYESDEGGEEFWTYGLDASVNLGEHISLKGSYVNEDDPFKPTQLMGAGVEAKLTPNTGVYFEYAYSQVDDKDPATTEDGEKTGGAGRLELRHTGERIGATIYGARSHTNFENASGSVQPGREEAGAQVDVKLWEGARASGELVYDRDLTTGSQRKGAAVAVEQSISDILRIEVGVRHAQGDPESVQTTPVENSTSDASSGDANGKIDSTSVRGRVTLRIPKTDAEVFAEYEQDIEDASKQLLTIGGALGLGHVFNDKVELYAKHEALSSLDNRFGLNSRDRRNQTLVGVRVNYLENSSIFSEYRIRDAISGREAEAAIGLNNEFYLSEGLALNLGLERIETVKSANGNDRDSLAASVGVEYTDNEVWTGTARLEFRHDRGNNEWLSTLGLGRKISRSWAFLGRNTLSINENREQNTTDIRDRLQLGFAYRDTDRNRWQALFRYELEYEDAKSSDFKRLAHLLTANVHYQPTGSLAFTGRYATKFFDFKDGSDQDDYTVHLLSARMTYDISERFDVGLIGTMLYSEDATQYGAGVEIGYLVWANLWASLGYNFFGLTNDHGLADFSNHGPYFRIRYKFDERVFSGGDPLVNNSIAPGSIN